MYNNQVYNKKSSKKYMFYLLDFPRFFRNVRIKIEKCLNREKGTLRDIWPIDIQKVDILGK